MAPALLNCYLPLLTALIVATLGPQCSEAKSFLADERVDAEAFSADVQQAVATLHGCGGEVPKEHLATVEQTLLPMWRTLPKNGVGRIDRRSLRYAVHRYFMQQSSISIRGFEPSRLTNDSHWGVADILSQQVPAYVESALESHSAQKHGFSLDDLVHMVGTLEQLIYESDRARLEKVYEEQHKPTKWPLSHQGIQQAIEAYVVHWMVGEDPEGVRILLANQSLLHQTLPHWKGITEFVTGQVNALEYHRHKTLQSNRASSPISNRFTFEDAMEVVGSITRSFASFWDSECVSMKTTLVNMDSHTTGRVPLSKFYNKALDTEWRFGESEQYLREMGALDETSRWHGKQVIIPNYLQAASNCIVSTPHYLVCCVNECESLLGEVEVAIGTPTATPEEILQVVGNMTAFTDIEDDAPLMLEGSLTAQLEHVAASHGGKVPLHGRLFAQWLHYVFPRECPFPHKAGVASTVTPLQFGDGYLARTDEMKKYADNVSATTVPKEVKKEELQWMSQWSPEEELKLDYSGELHAPWEQPTTFMGGIALLVFAALGLWGGAIGCGSLKAAVSATNDFSSTKAHCV